MADAQRVLEVTTARQKEIERPLSSLTKQRRDVLKKPGSLENLVRIENQKNLELIPVSKNHAKKHTNNKYLLIVLTKVVLLETQNPAATLISKSAPKTVIRRSI